ncbi:hypothetical protein CYANOKiyG1_69520 [Okeania sp. KiyG1]|nr:hypothetical protein CYANOKiyG1_69520 [Okeania sp. KiyG1]
MRKQTAESLRITIVNAPTGGKKKRKEEEKIFSSRSYPDMILGYFLGVNLG